MLQLRCIVLKLQFESVWPVPPVQAMPMTGCQIDTLLNQKRWKIYISVEKILTREEKIETTSSLTEKEILSTEKLN